MGCENGQKQRKKKGVVSLLSLNCEHVDLCRGQNWKTSTAISQP